ncbi:MAG TPA: VOC family protein [Kofleriaceae bacterium]|nr:VOC family protein [Kofleriaceae bacterium]
MRRCKPFNRGRTSDHKRLAGWYRDNLGLVVEDWGGAILKWPEDQAEDRGLTVWHVAERESKWFSPSTSSFMINYRVDDLTALLAQLKSNGVEIVKGPDTDDNGIFAWVMDPDGNKVELWEPKDMKALGLPIECVEHDEIALLPVLIEVAEGDGVPAHVPSSLVLVRPVGAPTEVESSWTSKCRARARGLRRREHCRNQSRNTMGRELLGAPRPLAAATAWLLTIG